MRGRVFQIHKGFVLQLIKDRKGRTIKMGFEMAPNDTREENTMHLNPF